MTERIVDIAKDIFKMQGFKPLVIRTLKYARFKYRKLYRGIFAEIIILFQPDRYFKFNGKILQQFYHRHNYTWANERCIEIPIIIDYIFSNKFIKIMEFGYVLPHYYPLIAGTTIIDKYEKGIGVLNMDIVDFKSQTRYDLIVSISTIEHVGFDNGEEKDGTKIIRAIRNMQNHLAKDGLMVLTTCIGYNHEMDRIIFNGYIKWSKKYFLKRVDKYDWEEVTQEEAQATQYDVPYEGANCVAVLEIKNG